MTDNPAELCRSRGWTCGTQLIGDEGFGPTIIQITAIGERMVLAKTLSHNGVPPSYFSESSWALEFRDWQEYDPRHLAAADAERCTARVYYLGVPRYTGRKKYRFEREWLHRSCKRPATCHGLCYQHYTIAVRRNEIAADAERGG